MTGTGTKADPYIIESWDEFKAGIISPSTESYYAIPEGTVWDMNVLEPNGVPQITFGLHYKSIHIDCRGARILNPRIKSGINFIRAYPNGSTQDKHLYLNNLNIENLYCSGTVLNNTETTTYTNYIYVNDCCFSGIITESGYFFKGGKAGYKKTYMYRCGLNLELNGYFSNDTVGYLYDTHIALSSNNPSSDIFSVAGKIGVADYIWTLDNCLMELNIHGNTNVELITYSNRTHNIIKAEGTGYKIRIYESGGMQVLCADDGVTVSYNVIPPPYTKAITKEQLKDVNYLRSIGFPIRM